MSLIHDFTYPAVTELRYKHLRFLITDSPDDESVQSFAEVSIFNYFIISIISRCLGLSEIRSNICSACIRKNLRYEGVGSCWDKSLCMFYSKIQVLIGN